MWKTLLNPLSFWKIKYHRKYGYMVVLPVLASIGFTVFYCMNPNIDVVGGGSLVDHCAGLVRLLAGFFFAGLGLVVSQSKNEWLLTVMEGTPKPSWEGKDIHRLFFLSHMFGYLAFVSIFLYLLGMVASIIPAVDPSSWYLSYTRGVFVFIYTYIFINIMVTTAIGIYFLSSDINQSKLILDNDTDADDNK